MWLILRVCRLYPYLTDTNEVMSTEHKILSASDGFWAPFAGRELGLSKRQLETQAYWSIESLKGQIAFLTEEQMWNDPLMDEWGLNAFPDSFMDFDSNDSDK